MADALASQKRCAWELLLLRLVGWVFLSEGIQKILFPAALGAGWLAKIGIPTPQLTGPFVVVVEIVCGCMRIFGFFAILAVILLLVDILVAGATTEVQMLFKQGFWATMHDRRADFCALRGLIAIARLGVGAFSLDGRRVEHEVLR